MDLVITSADILSGMTNAEKLEQLVWALYGPKDPACDDCADWLAANQVFAVADSAQEVAYIAGK